MKSIFAILFFLKYAILVAQPINYPFSLDGKKWGIAHYNGEVVVPPVYENEFPFQPALFYTAKLNNKYGVVATGDRYATVAWSKVVVPCIFDTAYYEWYVSAFIVKKAGA
jgi:hypothetical protein